jgi:hypothetical protein
MSKPRQALLQGLATVIHRCPGGVTWDDQSAFPRDDDA